jgi:hypothetical protein
MLAVVFSAVRWGPWGVIINCYAVIINCYSECASLRLLSRPSTEFCNRGRLVFDHAHWAPYHDDRIHDSLAKERALSAADKDKQEHLMNQAIAERRAESPSKRATRIAQYDKERRRDQLMMLQLADAFDFVLLGQTHLGADSVYVLKATPKPGYHPPALEAKALTGRSIARTSFSLRVKKANRHTAAKGAF